MEHIIKVRSVRTRKEIVHRGLKFSTKGSDVVDKEEKPNGKSDVGTSSDSDTGRTFFKFQSCTSEVKIQNRTRM